MAAGNKKLKTILFTNPDGSVSEALLFPGFAGTGVAETASRSDHTHIADSIAETAFRLWLTPTLKSVFEDKYTKLELDNIVAGIIHNMDWKESVNNFADIATTYPNPEDGWTVNAKLDDGGNGRTYRYSATTQTWVDVTGGIIPMATALVDGKMSKEDFVKLRDMVSFPGFGGSGIAETAAHSDHTHSASQVSFADAETLQGKFDAGKLKGNDGYTPVVGENNNWWVNGVDTLKKAVGADGKKTIMRKNTETSCIEWQYEGDTTWQTLCTFADIQGPKGADGTIDIFQNVEIFDSSKNNNPLTITIKNNTTIYKEQQSTAWAGGLTLAFAIQEPSKAVNKCVTFELHLFNGNNRSWNFPSNVNWYRGMPNILGQCNWIVLVFRTFDAGTTWVGDLSYIY